MTREYSLFPKNIEIRIKFHGKWYEAIRKGDPLVDHCRTCKFNRACNSFYRSSAVEEINEVCSVFGYGFKEVKEKGNETE